MATIPLQHHESFTTEGNQTAGTSTIGTWAVTSAGVYRIEMKSTFPAGTSMLGQVITTLSSTPTTYSYPSTSAAQTHVELLITVAANPGDIFMFGISSTAPTNSVSTLFNVVQTNSGI